MTETALVVRPEQALAMALADQTKLATLRDTLASDLHDVEFELFLEVCRATGLNPFQKQIYAIARGKDRNRKLTFQTGIDGYRLLADRTGKYAGQDEPEWCGADGVWRDIWTDAKEPPFAARVRVYRKDTDRPFTGIARYSEYVQTATDYNTQKVGPNSMWAKMPTNQLAKCAEALALRKAFPAEMSGVYTEDEMGQAENVETKDVTPARQAARETVAKGAAKAETAARERAKPSTEEAEKRQRQLDALPDWAKDAYLTLEQMGHKFSALSVVIGKPVTLKALEEWAAALPDTVDPYKEITSKFTATLPKPEPEEPEVVEGEVVQELVETPNGKVDPSTGEIVEEDYEVDTDPSQFSDDEVFA